MVSNYFRAACASAFIAAIVSVACSSAELADDNDDTSSAVSGCDAGDKVCIANPPRPDYTKLEVERFCGLVHCASGEYCNRVQCSHSDGVCVKRPTLCSSVGADGGPRFCACDGKSYANECLAHAAGVYTLRVGHSDVCR